MFERMTSMLLRCALLPLLLGSCSYSYAIKAVAVGGRLTFVIDPGSKPGRSCLNEIDVVASDGPAATPAPGDDLDRVGYGTYWHQRLAYDCVDRFPVRYGQSFTGKLSTDAAGVDAVAAKPLRTGVVYDVSTVSGATGYGSGAFKILADRRVLNVPPSSMLDAENMTEATSVNDR